MALILVGRPEGYRSLDKFFYKHELYVLTLDNRSRCSKKLGQWNVECILTRLYELWKSKGNFDNGYNIVIIPQIQRGSHKGKHIVVITNNTEVTSFGISYNTSNNGSGAEKRFSNYQRIIRNELHQ